MAQQQDQEQELEQVSPEDRIRMRAYYLWEQATDPKGTPDEYWEQARAEVEKESAGDESAKHGVLPTPTPTPARKP
ncbi:DUF2934 domain-containing protein [Paraburkholderia sp. BCC1885]|uniref:DUF2934 domain-containing protein n=1 Tax=Paraburkholderia sp. BCC1885 TaxID=2562669 RepID=UPI0011820A18|nr:DUF2934 domain-containing protein [Paraburkholderia sp. BCC1885]